MHTVLLANKAVPEWLEIKRKMIEQYGKDETTWELIIQKMKQEESEDPVMFADKIIRLCAKQNQFMSEKAIVAKVLNNNMVEEQRNAIIMYLNNTTIEKLEENLKILKGNLEKYSNSSGSKVLEELRSFKKSVMEMMENKMPKENKVKDFINLIQDELQKEKEKKEDLEKIPELINKIRLDTRHYKEN
jgi:ATP-dependent Lon protease